tara:strand:- start:326 stop:556 length:231 start_codon:yes stop_codon:yes gene_type:complete
MSLLNKLISGQASAQSLNGETPNRPDFQQSTLHNQYSTIGDPNAASVLPPNGILPLPSDLEANIQPGDKYLNNLPN